MATRAETVTILFTDLVGSTELLQRAGDEQAQRIFKAHHRLLSEAVQAHGGHEVKWLGDGLMVAFPSAGDAVRCAIAMQQAARRPAAGERLQVRAGLNVGEALRDETDYFGTAVVVARRLCDRADAGQIYASDLVVRLLEGRQDVEFHDLGQLQLKGITNPVQAHEVRYEHDPGALLEHTPFVGRADESSKLRALFEKAAAGSGAVAMLVGEPGIGKTRLADEFAEYARGCGATVVWGRCYEGEWAPPFSPFAEAIRQHAGDLTDDDLRAALGNDAPLLARVVPALAERLGDPQQAATLPAESERYRLLDAAASFFGAIAATRPLLVVLDDLHWADRGTVAMLTHVARGLKTQRALLLGTYRDIEVDPQHPLTAALAGLRRETTAERIVLGGLATDEVGQLLDIIAEQDVPDALAQAIAQETGGNPFFIREVLLHLVDEGKIFRQDGHWTSTVSIAELGIPEGVREVIDRRLARLSGTCNRMLIAASAMTGGFTWAELKAILPGDEAVTEAQLLDTLEEALGAQVIGETAPSTYDFTHALIRHALYERPSTPRRLMLHRTIGEALERLYAGETERHLAELAYHFGQAAGRSDAAKVIDYANRAGKHALLLNVDEVAADQFSRAIELLELQRSPDEPLRARLLVDLARAEVTHQDDKSMIHAKEAADIAASLQDAELMAEAALAFRSASDMGTYFARGDADARHVIAVNLLETALHALPHEDSALRAHVQAALSMSIDCADDRPRQLADEAVQTAARLRDQDALQHALSAQYYMLERPEYVRERLAIADKLVNLNIPSASLDGHFKRLSELLLLGDIAAVNDEIHKCEELQNQLRYYAGDHWVLLASAMRALLSGSFDQAEQLTLQALSKPRNRGRAWLTCKWPSRCTSSGGNRIAWPSSSRL